jgi:hypothetical protein
VVDGEPERESGKERDQDGYVHAVKSSVMVCHQASDITTKTGATSTRSALVSSNPVKETGETQRIQHRNHIVTGLLAKALLQGVCWKKTNGREEHEFKAWFSMSAWGNGRQGALREGENTRNPDSCPRES